MTETTTQPAVKQVYQAYPHKLMTTTWILEKDEVKYPNVDVEIPEGTKFPIYDWELNKVIDADGENQALIIENLKAQIAKQEEIIAAQNEKVTATDTKVDTVSESIAALTEIIVGVPETTEEA